VSDRRRSLFVLLIVAVLIGGSLAVVLSKPTKLGLDLQGGVQLVYHAEPTAQQKVVDADAMQRSIDLMQQRVNAFGVAEAELNQAGKDQIEVNLPGVKDAEAAASVAAGASASEPTTRGAAAPQRAWRSATTAFTSARAVDIGRPQ